MYFDVVMFWMSDYAWMANFRCHFLIKGLLTNRIALLLPVRGRTELGKMFEIDCRRFHFCPPLPFLAHLHPTSPQIFAHSRRPSSLTRLLAHLFDLSARKRKKRNVWKSKNIQDDILTISDSETERFQKRDSVTHAAQGIPRFLNCMKSFCDTQLSRFHSSSPNPPYPKNQSVEAFWRKPANMMFSFLILVPVSFKNNMYGLLTKCEVKMAGYWPSSFFACLWTETKSRSINWQKKNEANIQPSWPNKLGQ